jgi:hypothetical protein
LFCSEEGIWIVHTCIHAHSEISMSDHEFENPSCSLFRQKEKQQRQQGRDKTEMQIRCPQHTREAKQKTQTYLISFQSHGKKYPHLRKQQWELHESQVYG